MIVFKRDILLPISYFIYRKWIERQREIHTQRHTDKRQKDLRAIITFETLTNIVFFKQELKIKIS